MRLRYAPAVLLMALLLCGACGKTEAPAEVAGAYAALRTVFDADTPGMNIQLLEAFARQNDKYRIADEARAEAAKLRGQVAGIYERARDAERAGDVARAERILTDLAEFLPDTTDGREAARHMVFEFPFFKARQLVGDQQFDEAEGILRGLRDRAENPGQRRQIETLLDTVALSRTASAASATARFDAACRQVYAALSHYRARNHRWPPLVSVDLLGPGGLDCPAWVSETVTAIQDYRASGAGVSMTVVGQNGDCRARVTENGVQPEGMGSTPRKDVPGLPRRR